MPQQWKLGKNATTVKQKGKTLTVRYHRTDVVKATPKTITLDTGGWNTVTTRNRMTQASHQFDLGYYVYKKDGKLFAEYKGKKREFGKDNKDKIMFRR
jgi:hypothetical protein